jgi:hypothetical protein
MDQFVRFVPIFVQNVIKLARVLSVRLPLIHSIQLLAVFVLEEFASFVPTIV